MTVLISSIWKHRKGGVVVVIGEGTSQMTQGTRRTNQIEFKARPNIARECLDIFQYKKWSNIKNIKIEVRFQAQI